MQISLKWFLGLITLAVVAMCLSRYYGFQLKKVEAVFLCRRTEYRDYTSYTPSFGAAYYLRSESGHYCRYRYTHIGRTPVSTLTAVDKLGGPSELPVFHGQYRWGFWTDDMETDHDWGRWQEWCEVSDQQTP